MLLANSILSFAPSVCERTRERTSNFLHYNFPSSSCAVLCLLAASNKHKIRLSNWINRINFPISILTPQMESIIVQRKLY